MIFTKESDFEEALIRVLKTKGWGEVLKYPTEDELIDNWAKILFDNNRDIDRLNDYPLTKSEMAQILEQITTLKTPVALNSFINGKSVSIKRDNPNDINHFGKEISLKIYDRREIAAGMSRYQIAQQPRYKAKNAILNDRRGDLVLLINGMPVIHIELKRSGIPVSQAQSQIEKYSQEGVFTGLFSLVQIFVAMNPEETTYFANPGPNCKFNKCYYFHWADFNNEPINEWDKIGSTLLSIPMAHQLIGFYTVADNSDGVLKVMRSYQYYAANAIADKVSKNKWEDKNQLGGYVWHTTGSGKTLTSFKSAQLIASSKDADKVIFLMDRIELGTQSLKEYRGFADTDEDVQETEDTHVLVTKLKSDDPANTLIVTSIQKMSNIGREPEGLKQGDLDKINSKRIVFIIDECHRSTFGEMLLLIKQTFHKALFFGFTGTPIHDENQKKMTTTSDIFGNELHRYSIADGIRDKNVLGFDPCKVSTFKDNDLRLAVALDKAKAKSVAEVMVDKSIKKYLQDRNTAKLNSIKAANKTPEVPVDYFPIFIEGVKSVMRNETEDPEDRITAACIILYSQIGFRTSELFTVKTNCVHSVYSPDKNKPLYYMDFTSFKYGHGENGGTNAHTYMNELSLEAYNILLNLCSKARQKLNSDCLMVGKLQKNKAMTSQIFNERYRKFCLRHWRDLQNLNIGDDYEDLSSFEVSKFVFMGSDGYMTYDPNSEWAKDLKSTDRIYFPEIRQFRVSVCTSLYRQQIPLHYIRKHMNHLSEDMAAYYIRPQKNIEKEYSEAIYRAVFKDGSKMLGQNADAFVQKISDFIAANNYNIQDNTEEVITAIANKFPLRSKVGGMCIRCGEVIPCASNNPTDSIYCAFGMCQNHCHMFFMADISYDEYLRHKDVLEFNEKKGFKKAHQKELHKMKYIVENSLLPELNMLGEEIEKHGAEEILEKYPQLTYIVKHYSEIKEEVSKWTK